MAPDRKAIAILLDAYWSTSGWRRVPNCSEADFEYAKNAGLMFDYCELDHDQIVSGVRTLAKETTIAAVASAFLASLSTRRLDLRSALASFAVACNFPHHNQTTMNRPALETKDGRCPVCDGKASNGREPIDLNVLNFERFKWGGTRRLDPVYIWFDLREFRGVCRQVPTDEDRAIFSDIIRVCSNMPANAKPGELEKAMKGRFPSNESERRAIIEILGTCGILQPRGRIGFWKSFAASHQREHTGQHLNDWGYPVIWWRGSDGVNHEALNHYFGEF